MKRYLYTIRALSCGAISLGVLQGLELFDFNQLWFTLLNMLLNALVSLVFGIDPTATLETGGLFGGLFV